jgi:hypothetical protein
VILRERVHVDTIVQSLPIVGKWSSPVFQDETPELTISVNAVALAATYGQSSMPWLNFPESRH